MRQRPHPREAQLLGRSLELPHLRGEEALPGVIAHQSMNRGGERLEIHDLGDCPLPVVDLDAEQESLDPQALAAAIEEASAVAAGA